MRANKRTDKNPRGAGQKRSCYCDRWGCILCMNRYVQEVYRARRGEKEKQADNLAEREWKRKSREDSLVAIKSPNGKYKVYTRPMGNSL